MSGLTQLQINLGVELSSSSRTKSSQIRTLTLNLLVRRLLRRNRLSRMNIIKFKEITGSCKEPVHLIFLIVETMWKVAVDLDHYNQISESGN